MRSIFFIVFILSFTALCADAFMVFEKDGYYGIQDSEGQVTVPAVHEKLGWSDGSTQVFGEVIGMKNGNTWELISVRNKPLTEMNFHSLVPLKEGYIKAAVKGRLSNQLFYGVLDTKGKIKISFHYSQLTTVGDLIRASTYNRGRSYTGILNFDNQVLVPVQYREVALMDPWLVGTGFNQKKDLYRKGGQLIRKGLDSLRVRHGLVGYEHGYAGFFSEQGSLVHDFKYKSIDFLEKISLPVSFPTWEVHTLEEKQFEWVCDSLGLKRGIWIAHVNGAQHLISPSGEFSQFKNHLIESITNDLLVLRHSKTHKRSLVSREGKPLVTDCDAIQPAGDHFFVLEEDAWSLYDQSGTKLSSSAFQKILPGFDGQFIVKKNAYWGLIDDQGREYFTCKYDVIKKGSDHLYLVNYLGKWGIMNAHEEWIATPEYAEIRQTDSLMLARKGYTHAVFYKGKYQFKTHLDIEAVEGNALIVEDDLQGKGVFRADGAWIAPSEYLSVRRIGNFFELKTDSTTELVDIKGQMLVSKEDKFEAIGEIGEEYLLAKKNGRWGFLDDEGRLRIANRYDDARPFNEGLAAISLRNKWGFIDKNETLVIQPFYDEVASFRDGLAVVKSKNNYGLINKKGEEVMALDWAYIAQLKTGNFLVRNHAQVYGLADPQGNFLLRPDFEALEDKGGFVVVTKSRKMGVLDYSGVQKFSIRHEEIRTLGQFLVIRQ